MLSKSDRWKQRAFIAVLGFLVLFDGGVPYSAAALGFTLLSMLLFFSTFETSERSVLYRLRTLSIAVALVVTVQAVVMTHWDESGRIAHSVWLHLNEEFGAVGGTLAVTRSQAIWELPGALLPLTGFAVSIFLHRRIRDAERVWSALALFGGVFAAYGLLQQTLFPTWHFGDRSDYVDSLSGFYVNRNVAAAFLVMTSLATLVTVDSDLDTFDLAHWRRILRRRSVWRRVDRRLAIYVGLLLLELVALLLTKSRAGSVIGVGAISAFSYWRWRDRFSGLFVPSKRLMVLGILFAGLFFILISGRVAERYDLQGLGDSRWCVYPAILRLAIDGLPWGVGLGGFTNAFASYRQASCGIGGIWDSAHDLYLQGLVTMGVIFPAILLVMIIALYRPMIVALERSRSSRPYAQAVVIAAAALALHSLIDFPLEIPANSLILAILLASTIGISTDRLSWRSRRSNRPRRSGGSRSVAAELRIEQGSLSLTSGPANG